MATIADHVLGLSGVTVYLLVAAIVFAEDAFFLGFVIPGETAAVLGGVVAHDGGASVELMVVVVVVAAILGDSVGYEVGRRFGPRMLATRPLRRHAHRLDDARSLLARRGGWAVVLGRFTAFFRAVMPGMAGLSHMPYRTFLPSNALGGVIWGTGVVLVGYFAGHAYEQIVSTFGKAAGALVIVVVIAVGIALHVRRVRRERAEEEAAGQAEAGASSAGAP